MRIHFQTDKSGLPIRQNRHRFINPIKPISKQVYQLPPSSQARNKRIKASISHTKIIIYHSIFHFVSAFLLIFWVFFISFVIVLLFVNKYWEKSPKKRNFTLDFSINIWYNFYEHNNSLKNRSIFVNKYNDLVKKFKFI